MSLLKGLVELERQRLSSDDSVNGIADLIYRWNIEDFIQYANRDCKSRYCLSVSDLIYCSNKYWLKQKYPEIILSDNLYAAWASHGRLIHLGLQQLLQRYGFRIEYEASKFFKVSINDEEHVVELHGRLDAFGSFNGKLTVVEIKSSKSDMELPKEQHLLQLRIYMNMVNAGYGILVYVTPDRIAEYSVAVPLDDSNIKLLIEQVLRNNSHPRYPWECQYCPFSIMCPYKHTNNNRFHKR